MKSGTKIVLVLLALGALSAIVMTVYTRATALERQKAREVGAVRTPT